MPKIILSVVILFLSIFLIFPSAHPQAKTQSEFAVQLCKALGLEVPTNNYIAELQKKGISPEKGWQPDKSISNTEMADLLSKALGIEQETKKSIEKKLEEKYRDKATVLRFEGDVKVMKEANQNWVTAEPGMEIQQNGAIKTGTDSWVEMRVGIICGIKVKENTQISLSELSTKPTGSENIVIYMNIGEMLVDARGIPKGSDFQVRTPTTVAAVRGTIYNVEVTESKTNLKEVTD